VTGAASGASLRDRVVVVTGAAGGLGSAICEAFAAAGARVAVADLDRESGEAAARRLGDAAIYTWLDVADENAWEGALDDVEARLGGLDVLVNDAGFFEPGIAFEDMPIALWRRHFAVNSDGVFLGCKHAIRRMKRRGAGAIVNVGSGFSIKADPTASAYCASKAAVLMTTRTAAAAAGRYGVRVNAVLPGAVPTAMLMKNLRPGQSPEDLVAALSPHAALGRLASAADVARAVLFLADPANSALTGVALPVDAGNLVGA
jgi:NAD(P)-dependent dehydrogenase (short-subunit alcohol dehydrogenase family)